MNQWSRKIEQAAQEIAEYAETTEKGWARIRKLQGRIRLCLEKLEATHVKVIYPTGPCEMGEDHGIHEMGQ